MPGPACPRTSAIGWNGSPATPCGRPSRRTVSHGPTTATCHSSCDVRGQTGPRFSVRPGGTIGAPRSVADGPAPEGRFPLLTVPQTLSLPCPVESSDPWPSLMRSPIFCPAPKSFRSILFLLSFLIAAAEPKNSGYDCRTDRTVTSSSFACPAWISSLIKLANFSALFSLIEIILPLNRGNESMKIYYFWVYPGFPKTLG
jgi:hypothetical protein